MRRCNQSEELQRVADQLSRHDELLLATVFGSLASGRARTDSDLDVAVLGKRRLDASQRQALIQAVSLVSGRPVDLIDLRTAGPLVMREALSNGCVLFCKDERAYVNLLSRMVTDSADFLPYRQRMLNERRKAWIG